VFERSQNVVGAFHQQRSKIGIAFPADVQLRLALSGVPAPRLQPCIATQVATLPKSLRISRNQHVGQHDLALSLASERTCSLIQIGSLLRWALERETIAVRFGNAFGTGGSSHV
jgi:hypothetical protein